MSKVINFPVKPSDYGDVFHEVMDICLDVQRNGLDHLDATVKIMDIIDVYYKQEKTTSQ